MDPPELFAAILNYCVFQIPAVRLPRSVHGARQRVFNCLLPGSRQRCAARWASTTPWRWALSSEPTTSKGSGDSPICACASDTVPARF